MNAASTAPRRDRGLSLVELLVAIALGAILMGGAITLFVNNRATYEVTNDMARLQENARYALQVMSADIRMAGYVGCVNDVTKVNDNVGDAEGQISNLTHAIEGYEAGAATWSPSGFAGELDAIIAGAAGYPQFLADSDGITVRYFNGSREDDPLGAPDGTPDLEVTNASPNDANPTFPTFNLNYLNAATYPKHRFAAGQVAAAADCGGADLFTLTAAPVGNSITANALQRSYESVNRALVAPYVGVRYFVRLNDAGVPALHRSRSAVDPALPTPHTEITEELVDGVQSLQILYGVDANLDGLPDEFLPAGATSVVDPNIKLTTRNDYLSVVAVRIALLMATIDEFGSDQDVATYNVGDEIFCATNSPDVADCTSTFTPDRRRRRVFQTTVAVRNFL